MNWLAKINWNFLRNRLGAFQGLIVLVALVAGCIYGGYRAGNYYSSFQQTALTQQKSQLDSLYQSQEEHTQRINMLSVELELERLANVNAQSAIKALEDSNSKLKKELAFYQMVMAPEKHVDGLVIEDLEIYPTESKNHYRYRLVLVQQQKNKRFVKGEIDMNFTGSLNDKPKKVALSNVADKSSLQLSFNFKYFQILEGEVTLPDSFVPEKINILAKLPKTRYQKANRLDQSFVWPLEREFTEPVVAILD